MRVLRSHFYYYTMLKNVLAVTLLLTCGLSAWADETAVRFERNGTLTYRSDALGNRIPDFSFCGYERGNIEIPQVPAVVVVRPVDGDDGWRIQTAIDYVSQLPRQADGFRGAVRLAPGEFHIAGQLRIATSGVVLQGSGAGEGGTTLVATGTERRALIKVAGIDDRKTQPIHAIKNDYLPVGANALMLDSPNDFSVGDRILFTRPCTEPWIQFLGARSSAFRWHPGSRNVTWDRTVTEVTETGVTFDAPITLAVEKRFGGGVVQEYTWPGRIEQVGIEDLSLRSEVSPDRKADEDHAWYGIVMDAVENAWVRRATFHHFAGGAVHLGRHASAVTVEDCLSCEPVSEVGGYRRHTFFTLGQLVLLNRCWSEHGIHDFAVGHCAAGPNAFVQCRASGALGPSGPIESWASGVLYDNVRIDGNNLELQNRWNSPPATGWAAANCVLWQCRAAHVHCFRPPGADNWALGNWATHSGDGTIESMSDFVQPLSLYQGQLRQRVGEKAASRIDPLLGKPIGATNPTYDQAAQFVRQSGGPALRLRDVIEERLKQAAFEARDTLPKGVVELDAISDQRRAEAISEQSNASGQEVASKIAVKNGWLVAASRAVTGKRLTPSWWRGTIRAEEAAMFGHNISRFVPGREGLGLTELPREIADDLADRGYCVYEHHYGLWYDRRRDDHLMVRRSDGSVAPPFYEQPFARSGQGTAWDGLSKYDLTRYNAWYWNRLAEFARLCEDRNMLLVHHHYFQHNILEAGAHWVDCPWRPANNINDVPLPEPPPFVGDKRLFMAHNFYDITKPKLRELHRRYIRQCLDALAGRSNVIQTTSAEFTGPLHFTEFWLDTIIEWQREKGTDVLVALSCTKDVQDAILADKTRRQHADIIDIRYWTYDKDFQLYAPEGGKNLAPRQHLRQLRPQLSSFESIAKAVREYRTRFPEKAVIYNADLSCRSPSLGWAVLIGGGSLANVVLPPELAQRIPSMQPTVKVDASASRQSYLASDDGDYLFYFQSTRGPIDLRNTVANRAYTARWIDPATGKITGTDHLLPAALSNVTPKMRILWLSVESE